MEQKSRLDEKLTFKMIEEAENIWDIDLDQLPKKQYTQSNIRLWKIPPPEIDEKEFKKFGLRIISLIEEELLRLWILNRSDLFANLKEHFYPRPLESKEDRHNLIMKFASDEKELRWASVWMIWMKIGGLLEVKEEEFFEEKIDESIPAEYQELQKLNRKESEDFLKGNTYTRIRIAELGNENLNTLSLLGKNNLMINKAISEIKLLNKDIIELKGTNVELENKIKNLVDEENALKSKLDLLNEKKVNIDLINLKKRLEDLEKNEAKVGNNNDILMKKDNKMYSLIIRKLDFIIRAIKRMESKIDSWNFNNYNSFKKKKQNARKFYELRQRIKESKEKKLKAVKKEELSN